MERFIRTCRAIFHPAAAVSVNATSTSLAPCLLRDEKWCDMFFIKRSMVHLYFMLPKVCLYYTVEEAFLYMVRQKNQRMVL